MNKIGRPAKNRESTNITLPKPMIDRLRQERDVKGVNISHTVEKALKAYWEVKNEN